ncbi:MAG: hypothetical protein R3F60_22055 [bacterium]
MGAAGSLAVHRVPLGVLRPALDRAAENGVIPPVGDRLPVPIGVAREAQVAALRAHLVRPAPGLPHPTAHPVVVWMVDDDMAFEQRDAAGRVGRQTNLLFRVARFWAQLPQHSVVLGTYTGDPPVPGLDCLGGQLGDLAVNIARMRQLGPDAGWPPDQRSSMLDAYYDLTEAVSPETGDVWPYACHRTGEPVRTVALGLMADLARLIDGQQLTRQLTWDGAESTPRPSLRRGGNTVFGPGRLLSVADPRSGHRRRGHNLSRRHGLGRTRSGRRAGRRRRSDAATAPQPRATGRLALPHGHRRRGAADRIAGAGRRAGPCRCGGEVAG